MTTDKVSVWRERVAAWRASGKTATAYAGELGVHPVTLLNWARRIEKEGAASAAPKRPSVTLAPVVRRAPAMPAREATKAAPVVIELAGARLLVTAGADERALTLALRALGAAR